MTTPFKKTVSALGFLIASFSASTALADHQCVYAFDYAGVHSLSAYQSVRLQIPPPGGVWQRTISGGTLVVRKSEGSTGLISIEVRTSVLGLGAMASSFSKQVGLSEGFGLSAESSAPGALLQTQLNCGPVIVIPALR